MCFINKYDFDVDDDLCFGQRLLNKLYHKKPLNAAYCWSAKKTHFY